MFVEENRVEQSSDAPMPEGASPGIEKEPAQTSPGGEHVGVGSTTSETAQRQLVEALRQEFLELRKEVDALTRSLEGEIPGRYRGVSLSILRDRINKVLEEDGRDAAKSQVLKIERALESERKRSFQLEHQLRQLSTREDAVTITQAQLVQTETEVADLKQKNATMEEEIGKLRLKIEHYAAEQRNLLHSLSKANAEIREMSEKSDTATKEHDRELREMHARLGEEEKQKLAALEKVRHLEKIIEKLTEDSPTSEDRKPFFHSADKPSSRGTIALPDPPLDDVVAKEREGTVGEIPNAAPLSPEPQRQEVVVDHAAKEADNETPVISESLPASASESRWRLNIAGLWGYVTGEPAE